MEKVIISCLESRIEKNRSVYARFLLGPFKDDQAVTIATALRRSLLSKVKSVAITAIHIQGVTHEFSTIVGVRESVLDLAFNFQQIILRTQTNKQDQRFHVDNERQGKATQNKTEVQFQREQDFNLKVRTKPDLLKIAVQSERRIIPSKVKSTKRLSINERFFSIYSDHETFLRETTQIGYLQVQGPAVIYANDLKLPVGIECVDPTQYIATLSTEGLLVVKFIIGGEKACFDKDKIKPTTYNQNVYQNNSGLLADQFRSFYSTIGLRNTIFLDPTFDSVFQVNYVIEKDDLFNQPRERVLLELWTNGSVHPRQALHKASLSLISTFSVFRNVFHLDSL